LVFPSNTRFLFLPCLFLLPQLFARGQDAHYTFRHLTTSDGLASNQVTGIIQDRKGFIWISTANGLQRYDGYSFTTFQHNPLDTNSILAGNCLLEDAERNIWLATWPWGFSRFNETTGKNLRFYDHTKTAVRNLNNSIDACVDKDGNVWLASANLLAEYDIHTHVLHAFESVHPRDDELDPLILKYDPAGNRLWMTNIKYGICVYDISRRAFYYRDYNPDHLAPLNFKGSGLIYLDHENCLWQSANPRGLLRFNLTNGDVKEFRLPKVVVQCMLEDRTGTFWFGVRENGLMRYSPRTGSFDFIKRSPEDPEGLNYTDGIVALCEDRDGNIWAGSDKGIYIFNPHRARFTSVPLQPGNNTYTDKYSVQSAVETPNGDIWLATYGSGIFVYDPSLKFKRTYTSRPGDTAGDPHGPGEPFNRIWSFLSDDNKILVGSHHGWFSIFDPATGKFRNSHPAALEGKTIMNMAFDRQHNIWMALYGAIAKWDRKNDRFAVYHPFITYNGSTVSIAHDLVVDADNKVWVATLGSGLQQFDPDSGRYTKIYIPDDGRPGNISSSVIYCVISLDDSTLALGTLDGGIDLFNRLTGKFTYITSLDGLPANTVSALYFHPPSELWAATGQGLCKVNLRTKHVTTFGRDDGILSDEFGDLLKFHRLKEGHLVAGYSGGFVCFDPDSIGARDPPRDVTVTGIGVFDHALPIDSVLGVSDTAHFSYRQNFISIQYASFDYIAPEKLRYSYRLEGIDQDWVLAGTRRVAYYTHLPGGHYIFRVRCENSDGIPSRHITSLFIFIRPPFWETWWFYTLCALVLAFTVYFLYSLKIKDLKRKLEFRNAVARDLHDDLGSTLSGINIYSRLALEKIRTDGNESESLMTIVSDRAEKMMDTLSDIVWSLNTQNDKLENTLAKMKEFTAELLEPRHIACKWLVQEEVRNIHMDASRSKELYLIFKEAVNNAAKYSDAQTMTVNLAMSAGRLAMTIADDGRGFRKEDICQGNGLRNMNHRARKLGATFDLISLPGKGTRIELAFPVP
jgi:ligand-binding sensor domain-containing protein/two-component sensor histidine kinase